MSVVATFRKSVGRTEPRGFDALRDVEHVEAFGDHDRVNINVATRETVVEFHHIRIVVEEVLSGFERWLLVERMPQHECIATADDASIFQFPGNAARGVPGAQHDERLPGRCRWDKQAKR